MNEIGEKSDRDMAKLIDDIDDGSPVYVQKVHGALYRGVAGDLSDQLSNSPLLLAVAALLTGTRRGRVTCVVTYNYDDLLKQYLEMLGYSVCVRTRPTDISAWADAEINHVHGYLPQSGRDMSKACDLILSEKSYRGRRSLIDEGWPSYVEHCLYSKTGLFMGLSGDDGAILDVLKRATGKISRASDYTGYWLMTPSAYDRNRQDIVDVGMCPIRLEEKDFPRFVFSICRDASQSALPS